jgi:hypothetical protein
MKIQFPVWIESKLYKWDMFGSAVKSECKKSERSIRKVRSEGGEGIAREAQEKRNSQTCGGVRKTQGKCEKSAREAQGKRKGSARQVREKRKGSARKAQGKCEKSAREA